MWKITLSEIKYTWGFAAVLPLITLSYTLFCLNDFQLLEGAKYEVDYWGGIFALFFYLMFYTFWMQRIREHRLRTQTLLPITQTAISLSRILIIQGSAVITAVYLTFVHLLILDKWHQETGSVLMQLGAFYLSIQLFLAIRDFWFSADSTSVKITNTLLSAAVLLILLYWFFVSGRLFFYGFIGWDFGRLSLLIIALLLSPVIHFTFRKRLTYLS